jgi:hypothetical protein
VDLLRGISEEFVFILVPSIIVALAWYWYLKKYGTENIMHEMVKDVRFYPNNFFWAGNG